MKSFGSVWVLAVAQIAATWTDARGLLYITSAGELLIVDDDSEAPEESRYVATLGPDTNPLFVAARLAHVTRFL